MIADFRKYGEKQFITFDITYNLIKEVKRSEEGQNKKWGVGFFLGKNNHNKALCFCICILNTETANSLAGVFKSFFEMMNG
jgi:hypothetical protein